MQISISGSFRIKDGDYATSLTYVEKLCSIIEKWNLTQYDAKDSCGGEVFRWYRVQFCPPGVYTIVAVSDGVGAFKWGKLKSGIGWIVLEYTVRL